MIVVALFSRLFVTMIIHTDLNKSTQGPLSYAIMGDMGSSGSRVYVYSYRSSSHSIKCATGRMGEFEGLSLIDDFEAIIKPKSANEKKPGIDSIAKPPFDATEYFSGLLNFAKQLVPQEQHSTTPFFIYATAGLRVIAEKNGERIFDDDDFDENHILDDDDEDFGVGVVAHTLDGVRRAIHASPFYFKDSHVRVLKGEEEAMFDWISLQQMLHNSEENLITRNNDISLYTGRLSSDSAYPFGIIDTGGASSQIAYLPSHMNEGNVKTDVLGGIDTNIIARSFLGYGMYESRSTVEGNVIQRCIDNPNCDTNNIVNPCFSWNNTQHNSYKGKKYEIHGGGDFDACYEEVLNIFDLPECDGGSPCGIHGIPLPQPRPGTKFLAIDNVNRAAEFYLQQGPSSLETFEIEVKKFCATEWNEAMRIYGPRSNEFRIKKYCYEGIYTLVLLHHGYKFPMDTKSIIFTDYLNGMHINWPLGAMAYELNRMCKEEELDIF